MDEAVRLFGLGEGAVSVAMLWQLVLAVLIAAVVSALIGLLYRRIQAEGGYSQTLVHTFVLMAMVTAIIMVVIGSNIARAFSLIGALSIIRFRTAIKSPLDVGFLFWCMAVGMASGTHLGTYAIVGSALVAAVLWTMRSLNFASYPARREFLLSVVLPSSQDMESALDGLLGKHFEAYSFAYAETLPGGDEREVVYSVRPRADLDEPAMLKAVQDVNGGRKASWRAVRHAIEVP